MTDNTLPLNMQPTAVISAHNTATVPPAMGKKQSGTVSIKFMITRQNEIDLLNLGYTQPQINRIKPEEAGKILRSGIAAKIFYTE